MRWQTFAVEASASDSDLVLRGGRVIDPETGLDAVRDVAVARGHIAAIGTGLRPGPAEVDVAGQVVTAGFVDLHSHVNDLGGLVSIDLLDEDDPDDCALLMRSLTFPGAVVASDAMPLTWTVPPPDPLAWPLPPTAITHPRTAGTFCRALRLLTRDGGQLSLARALGMCSLQPARLLQDRVPAMHRKGRLQVGMDADIVVFDPATITDQASYRHSTRPSTGIRHVLVNGTFVVRDGVLAVEAPPGRPVRASPL